MHDQNLVLNRWMQEQEKFEGYFSVIRKRLSSAAMHDIRVSIKKLRAFWKLYTLLKKRPAKKELLNKTVELYAVLGSEQELETSIKLIKLYEKENRCRYHELTEFLESRLRKAKGWVKRSVRAYNRKELTGISALLKKDRGLKDEKTMTQHTRETIRTYLLSLKDDLKQTHKVRKKLKKVYYWLSVMPMNVDGTTPDARKLHDIGDELGEWRDNEVLLAKARHFREDFLPKTFNEAALVKTLEEKIEIKNEKTKRSALGKIRGMLKKVAAAGKE